MKGFTITYKPKDGNARTLLNHTLYGRLVYKNRRGKKIAYYIPGLLDTLQFSRLLPSKIFVEEDVLKVYDEFNRCSLTHLKEGILDLFGDVLFNPEERDEEALHLKTGRQHWQDIAKEKGYTFYVKRKK